METLTRGETWLVCLSLTTLAVSIGSFLWL